jgi:hypothetical protein
MPRLPDLNALGARPVPVSRRGVAETPGVSAVGRAVEGLGQTVAKVGEDLAERHDKAQYAIAATASLKASNEQIAGFDTDPDYGSYEKRYRERMAATNQESAKLIGNNQDREAFLAQGNVEIERNLASVGRMARAKLEKAEMSASESAIADTRKLAVEAATPEDRERAVLLGAATYDGLVAKGYMDPNTAQLSKRKFAQGVFYDGIVAKVSQGQPDEAEALLKQLAPRMDENDVIRAGDAIRVRRAGLEAETRRVAAEARAEQAHQTAVLKDQLGAVEQVLNAGGGSVEDRYKIAQQYRALGDVSKATEWQIKGDSYVAVQGTRDWTLPQMDSQIVALTAKQGSKGGLTATEAAQLNGLKEQRSQSASRITQPGGALLQYQYATGKPITPIDLEDPATLSLRASEATAAAAKYGRAAVEPLLPEEVEPLKDLIATGDPAQKAKALQIIAGFKSPRAIAGAARQVTGESDGAFRVAATRVLAPNGREVANAILGGGDALKANPGLWQKPNDDGKLVTAEADAQALFAEYLPALAGLGPNAANDTYEAAKAFYGAKMNAAGQTQFAGGAWRNAIETVIGRYSKAGAMYGGTSQFQGHRVVVPEGWTGEGLFRRIARATPDDWAKAGGGKVPVWPDGSKVYTGQLRELVPVWLGGTSYGFRSPKTNSFLPKKDGGPFIIDAAKVPWR